MLETIIIVGIVLGLAVYELSGSSGQAASSGSNIPTGMGVLSADQIQQYASNAGFSDADGAVAASVAIAESGGNPDAYNPESAAGTQPGQGSYGLWQIYLTDHPEYQGVNLYDPQTNANAAFAIFSAAGSFAPWSTYNSGAYLQNLDEV